MAHNMNLETARKILIDILKAIALPENSKRLSEAKCKRKFNVFILILSFNDTILYSTKWKGNNQVLPTGISCCYGNPAWSSIKLWICWTRRTNTIWAACKRIRNCRSRNCKAERTNQDYLPTTDEFDKSRCFNLSRPYYGC